MRKEERENHNNNKMALLTVVREEKEARREGASKEATMWGVGVSPDRDRGSYRGSLGQVARVDGRKLKRVRLARERVWSATCRVASGGRSLVRLLEKVQCQRAPSMAIYGVSGRWSKLREERELD